MTARDWYCANGHRCAPEEGVCMLCGAEEAVEPCDVCICGDAKADHDWDCASCAIVGCACPQFVRDRRS